MSHLTAPCQRKLLKILNARIDCKILVNKKKRNLSYRKLQNCHYRIAKHTIKLSKLTFASKY